MGSKKNKNSFPDHLHDNYKQIISTTLNKIQQIITSLFHNDPEVTAVYLFGSQATQKNHINSDIDLAILFE